MRDRSTSVKGKNQAEQAGDGTNVLFDVWLVSRATSGVLDATLAPSGLTADEFGIYSVLTSSDTMTPSDLARWMAAPLTTVSSYIKRLEARGHVQRVRNPADGRSYVLKLTPAGRATHRDAGRRFLKVLGEVEAALGTKEPGVRRSLAALHRAVGAASPPAQKP